MWLRCLALVVLVVAARPAQAATFPFHGGAALLPFRDQTTFLRLCDAPTCAPLFEVRTAPEPESLALVSLAALLTHWAFGGKMRRKSGSTGEPT